MFHKCAHAWWKCLTSVPSQHLDFEMHQHEGIHRSSTGHDRPVTSPQHNISTFPQIRNAWAHSLQTKRWLKRVTGSALISVSWVNAREFSTIVRSFQRGDLFLPGVRDLLCFHRVIKTCRGTVGRIELQMTCLPSHFSDKEQWSPHK